MRPKRSHHGAHGRGYAVGRSDIAAQAEVGRAELGGTPTRGFFAQVE